jgi:glutamyl-tRNA synthetase
MFRFASSHEGTIALKRQDEAGRIVGKPSAESKAGRAGAHGEVMNPQSPAYVGRLAPSPTGAQHVGNARTYLIAWLRARSQNCRLVLRIEDIDSPRIKAGAAEQALDDLRWLGLDWDGEPIVQTERLPLYENALERLRQRELVYPCTCSRSDVERAASAPHDERPGAVAVYPGTCSGRRAADGGALTVPYCWRFRLPERHHAFDDGYRGRVEVDLMETGGDFVVWKSSGTPAYQLAVVVDDADQGVTEVIRGDDLIPSTPRQLLLYEALGLTPPNFVHVPLVVGPDGRRLAKRHGDTRLSSLRQAGVTAKALLGLLAWSCGWLDEPQPVSAVELLPIFTLNKIPFHPFVLTSALLTSIGYRS